MASRPLRNSITVASLAGIAVTLTELRIPDALNAPIALIGGMPVPSMLLAYGVSLRLGPVPDRGVPASDLDWQLASSCSRKRPSPTWRVV